MPRMYIISGCNASGKTTASYSMLPEIFDCSQYVNSDEFAKSIAPFNPEGAYVAASRLMLLKTQFLFRRKADFCIETTLATRSLLKMVKDAQAQGYFVTVLYFWLRSADLAIERVRSRVAAGGHNVPEETIRRRYKSGQKYFFEDYAPLCDRWILADNSVPPFREIAQGTKGGNATIVKDPELYESIRRFALED